MATIPIEIIVQDAETPVVPGEDGTNINTNTEATVAVPDTGSGIGNIFTGSTSSIVLPVVLLVLVIGSIVAILIHKYHKQKEDKTSKKERLAVAASSTIAVLAIAVLIGNLAIPATKAATSDVTDGIVPAEDKVSITVTRDGGSAEASIESTATITSSSDFGYKVLLSMAEGVETSNLYLNGDEDSEYYIVPVNSEETEETETNIWGYALEEDGEYSAMPLLDDVIVVAQGDEPVEDEEMTIYYGVKISKDLPNGTYSGGKIEYSLESIDPTIDSLTYMQDFARLSDDGKNSVLGSMPEETTYTLKDKRDDQDYTIAKLKDGKVWMTKNLNLAGGSEITSELSDVSEGYVLPVENGFQEGNKLPESDSESFDNQTKAALYNTGNDTTDCSAPGCYSYYSWHAATVGSGVDITEAETDAPYSICPKGWKLPNSRNTVAGNSDYYQLAVAYGMDPSNTRDYSSSATGSNFYDNAGPGTIPNFLFVGNYSIQGFSSGGNYSSSTFAYEGWAKILQINQDAVFTESSSMIRDGYGVRCLVR